MKISTNKLMNQHLEIWSYITSIRQKGKTSLLRTGIDNYDKPFHLLCIDKESGKLLTKNKKCKLVTLSNIDKLNGSDLPLIVDQEAIAKLSEDTVESFKYQEKHFETQLDKVMAVSSKYQSAYHDYVNLTLSYLDTYWWEFRKRSGLKRRLIEFKEINVL